MKIGTKLAICFVALAVLPLGAASFVYLRATQQFGDDMAERGKELLEERVHRDLRRATELGAVTIEETRETVAREVRFLVGDIAARLSVSEDNAPESDSQSGFLIDSETAPEAKPEGAWQIDMQHLSVHVAPDASRDRIAGTLKRLRGFNDVARTIYLRNRGAIDTLTISFESGLTVSYPGRALRFASDPREQDWYLTTLEALETAWFDGTNSEPGRISVSAPVQLADGRLVGATRISIRLDALLTRSVDGTRLPPGADAYLISVPDDDPELAPHEIGRFSAENGQWNIVERPQPLLLNGDDSWLKVVSDMRSGVPGLEYVERDGNKEIWSFGPAGRTEDSAYHIAVSVPADIITVVSDRVEEVVLTSYREQLRAAIVFTLVAGLIAAALAIFGAKTLTSPIRRLHEAASKLARGDFSVRIQQAGRDEIGDLARGFNRMVPALEEQLRVKRDLYVAQEIQQHLIPATPPEIKGHDIAGRTIYCDETGGDYQDYMPLDGDNYAVVVGDVTGHGVGAALLMVSARALMRANLAHHKSPDKLLASINRQLSEDSSGGRSLTLFYLQLKASSRDIDWISAGHEAALVFDPKRDAFTLLEGEDIPLGVDADWTFTSRTETLPEGGVMVVYTDGLREARNGDGVEYGLDRLQAVIKRGHPDGCDALIEAIFKDLETFRDGTPAIDDISVVAIRPV
ncbi:MAG: SpoIIE family protein phosphatase [Rhodospirillales bacterium]|nr:SpoIIE family protein phosphatase [Rhodospirillales bacterium]